MVTSLPLIQVNCLFFPDPAPPACIKHRLCWLTERVGHRHFGQGSLWQVQQETQAAHCRNPGMLQEFWKVLTFFHFE